MNDLSAQYMWSFIASEVIGYQQQASEALDSARYEIDEELPRDIEALLSAYFASGDRQLAVEAAITTARRFYLSSYRPEDHLLLVAYLLDKQIIASEEACKLAQIDHSNFALMGNDAKNVVRIAETLAEERHLGLFTVGADSLLEQELQAFCSSKRIRCDQQG